MSENHDAPVVDLTPDAADVTEKAESAAAAKPESYTLRYNGRDVDVPFDALITSAQKGLNYDRVVAQRDKLRKEVETLSAPPDPVEEGFRELFARYPDLREIPDEIYAGVAAGATPADAYRDYLNKQLMLELEALKTGVRNQQTAVGSMTDDAPPETGDSFLSGLFGK